MAQTGLTMVYYFQIQPQQVYPPAVFLSAFKICFHLLTEAASLVTCIFGVAGVVKTASFATRLNCLASSNQYNPRVLAPLLITTQRINSPYHLLRTWRNSLLPGRPNRTSMTRSNGVHIRVPTTTIKLTKPGNCHMAHWNPQMKQERRIQRKCR